MPYTVSYKNLVTCIGYSAAQHVSSKWKEKIVESEVTNKPDTSNTNQTLFDVMGMIKSTIPDIQNNIGNMLAKPHIYTLHDVIYKVSETKNIPCAFHGFTDFFDKDNNPIIISSIDDTTVLFDMADKNYFDIPVRVTLPHPFSIVCNNGNFLCARFGQCSYFFNETGAVPMPMFTKITAVGLSDTMFALGTDSGQILFSAINEIPNINMKYKVIPARHLSGISALALHNHIICSGDTHGIVKLWDCRTSQRNQCMSTHKKNMWSVTSLLLDSEYIRVGCNNGTLLTYDQRKSFIPIYQFPETIHNKRPILSLAQKDNTLYSATESKFLCWKPSFDLEQALNNLSFEEKVSIHRAMQISEK